MDEKNVVIYSSNEISNKYKIDVQNLLSKCFEFDKYKYNPYLENEDNNLTDYFYFLYKDSTLITFISIYNIDGSKSEIYACTHPDYRNTGYFKFLYNYIKKTNPILNSDKDFEFPIDSMALSNSVVLTLSSFNFELFNSEYMMEKFLSTDFDSIDLNCEIELEYEENEYGNEISLWKNDIYIGGCLIDYDGNPSFSTTYIATIYEFGIVDDYQGKGYGKTGLLLIIMFLATHNCAKVLLQVSGNNKKARNLYNSCGFKDIKCINYYQYSNQTSINQDNN